MSVAPRRKYRHGPDITLTRADRALDPSLQHLPLYRQRKEPTYTCLTCEAECDGPALYCRDHLRAVALRP